MVESTAVRERSEIAESDFDELGQIEGASILAVALVLIAAPDESDVRSQPRCNRPLWNDSASNYGAHPHAVAHRIGFFRMAGSSVQESSARSLEPLLAVVLLTLQQRTLAYLVIMSVVVLNVCRMLFV